MLLCVFSEGKKWRLEKGKIIQEILRISKIPFRSIQIEAIQKKFRDMYVDHTSDF